VARDHRIEGAEMQEQLVDTGATAERATLTLLHMAIAAGPAVVTPRPAAANCRELHAAYRTSLDQALASLAAGNEDAYERYFDIAAALGQDAMSQQCSWARG
jgi:hypothetical protein